MNRNITTIVLIILALGFWFGISQPKYQKLTNLNKEAVRNQLELERREEYFVKLTEAFSKLQEYEDDLAKIDSALPADDNPASLFEFLQRASSQSGLVLKELQPVSSSPILKIPGLKEQKVSFAVAGSYENFKEFISKLENSARLVEVESISFNSPQEGEVFSFNLGIKVYSY